MADVTPRRTLLKCLCTPCWSICFLGVADRVPVIGLFSFTAALFLAEFNYVVRQRPVSLISG
jgi:hypothetical protein